MPAGLSFKKNATDDATNLKDVRIITLEDSGGSKYTLDITGNDLKVEYTPSGGNKVEKTITGLATALGSIFNTKNAANTKTVLEEEVAKKPVAEAILGAKDGKKSILVEELGKALDRVADNADDKVYGTDSNHLKIAKDFLADKYPLAKTDASNLNENHKKAFAEAILGVEYTDSDSKKRSVLVEELGKSLGKNTDDYKAKYDESNEQTAIDFLKSKGLEPASASEVATQLLSNANKDKLGTAILGVKKDVGGTQQPALETDLAANENFQTAVAGNSALKTAVTTDTAF